MSGTYIVYNGQAQGSSGGSGGAPLTVGSIDSATPSSNGAVIGSASLFMQSASTTNPGLVNNTTQVFSGSKTFSQVTADTVTTGSVSQTSTPGGGRYTVNWPSAQGSSGRFLQNDGSGNLTWSLASGGGSGGSSVVMGAFNSIAPTANGATIGSGFLFLQASTATFPGLVSSNSQTFAGAKTFTSTLDMSSNKITSLLDPTAAQDAATKNYVDTQLSAFQPKEAVSVATIGANIVSTYSNGVSGVGATLTVTATGAFTLDGVTPAQGSRILIKDQSNGFENGIYDLTIDGHLGVSPVLTRSLDYNTVSDINAGDLIPVISGTVNQKTSWLQTAAVTTVGSDNLIFTQYSANPQNIPISVGAFDSVAPSTNGAVIGSSSLYLQGATATFPGLVSSNSQTFAGVKTFSSSPIISTLSASAPVLSDGSKALVSGSISLTTQVSGNLPLSQTSGSISLTTQVSGILPVANGGGGFANPMTNPSDIIIGSASGTAVRLGTNSLPGQVLITGSSSGASLNWVTEPTIKNLSFKTVSSLDANSLSLTFVTAQGATPSPSSPGLIPVQIATGTGVYKPMVLDSDQNITVPSTATLGLVSSFTQYVWVYALTSNTFNGFDFGVSASVFPDGSDRVTVVQLSTTSSNSSVLYGRNSSGLLNTRLLGRVSTKQTTAGNWTATVTSPLAAPVYAATEWTICTMTFGAVTTPPTLSAPFFQSFQFRRDGGDMLYRGQYLASGSGTVNNGSGAYLPSLPTDRAYTIDTRYMVVSTVSSTPIVGNGKFGANAAAADIPCLAGVAGSTSLIFWKTDAVSVAAWGSADTTMTANFKGSFDVRVPIYGWSAFGPIF